MTDFEDYTTTSKNYDEARRPIGVEVILGSIAKVVGGELKKAHLVDIGCGTGNYAAALSPFVGQITGVEYNSGMLEQAKMKTAHLSNVKLMQGEATKIPLSNGVCDAVLCTQVLHHLPESIPPHYNGSQYFFNEAYRILKDNGVLLVNVINHEQAEKGWFVLQISPAIGKRHKERYAPMDVIRKQMADSGFFVKCVLSHCQETHMIPELFLDPKGPLSQTWRNFDSVWALLTPEELEETLAIWKKKVEDGTAQQFIEENEEVRRVIGQTSTVVAYKGMKM